MQRKRHDCLFFCLLRIEAFKNIFLYFCTMRNWYAQTKQAFHFSLMFYIGATILLLLKVSIAPMLFSFSLVVSMIWVLLVLREIMISSRITNQERLLLILFIILLNIFAGIVYFYLLRKKVVGDLENQK